MAEAGMADGRTEELAGRVAIVTGGGRGIGRAAAERLAAAGAAIVLTGRTAGEGEDAAASIARAGGRALYLPHDVAVAADWAAVVDRTMAEHGRIDILIANAGAGAWQPLEDGSLADLRWQLDVNLRAGFLGLKHVAPVMKRAGGGSIVLLSSTIGKVGGAGFTAYSAAKGGLRVMAKAAALEFGADKVRVNALLPGLTHTAMTAGVDPVWLERIPLRRGAEPREMADALLFLASDRSRFMTGAELIVDGGMTAQ
ncbi:SDR family NAD(P)-dependent oxidoreductase [Sphingomonas profundi]|uniref:SDR family NAD(P)-dependent oxidoreductase n=1 Tax=Alterirhizorhabdus profundi TaxID=2681549 RepID=UPI0012E88966|nr:SDR family oxidoreductase [Sphingomonas profundi]